MNVKSMLSRVVIDKYYCLARPHEGLNGDTPVPSAKLESAADASRFFDSRGRRFTTPLHPEWPPNLLLHQTNTK